VTGAHGPAGGHAGAVLVIDDHELVGSLIVTALAGRGLRAHRCPVTTAEGILAAARDLGEGLALLDLDLGVGVDNALVDEIDLIRGLGRSGWRSLVVSGATDERRVAAAVAAGAIGFVPKGEPLDTLLDVVGTAAAGQRVLAPDERENWLGIHRRATAAARARRAKLDRLTGREREVLALLARGERAGAIAESAVVSLTTVRSQIRSILTKLEVNSQLEAAALLREDTEGPTH
jgi:DNA-binding NarL/FixJ family response regulator